MKPLRIFGMGIFVIALFFYLQFSYTTSIKSEYGSETISEIDKFETSGTNQYLTIRGNYRKSPLLLIVHGGPGTPITSLMRKHNSDLEKDFIVVYWEQRGAGKSYTPNMNLRPFTLERYVEDTRLVTEYLLKKFQREKVILLGHSWGSLVGLSTAYKYPELFYSFIGVGQNIDIIKQELLTYNFTLEKAMINKDKHALNILIEIGPPKGGRYRGGKESILKQRRLLSQFHGDSLRYNLEDEFTQAVINCTEYSWIEKALFTEGISSSLKASEEDLEPYNLMDSAPILKVPIFLVSGRNDGNASPKLVQEYFNSVKAPLKEYIELESSAHYPMLDEPRAFREILLRIWQKSK